MPANFSDSQAILNLDDIRVYFRNIAGLMDANRELLCRLDGALGDGDLGVTMAKGFRAIEASVKPESVRDIGDFLSQSALVIEEGAAGTMGTLIGSGLEQAGIACAGRKSLDCEGVARLIRGLADGISARGKARQGDKTILDSLVPAAEALESASREGKALDQAVKAASAAAEQGARSTAKMQSRHGRAARYLERSIGPEDSGAVAGALMIMALVKVAAKS